LSGGGALGLAHIGVIRWLQENRIPVDYIAGTSMGGLVAGAYASGMNADQLEDLIRGIDWTEALRGSPAYSDLSFRRKEDHRVYPSGIEFGMRKGFRLPAAFNPGHEVGLIFDRIALPYSTAGSFDELPTPFRCVAADLVSGHEIVLSDGSLADALRATMAIPGVFAPVKQDSMVLVDGGLLNNLPVDVVREMGAEIIIAVDVGNAPVKEEDLESILGVADRALSVMIRVNVERNLKHADHVIQPRLEDFGAMEFGDPGPIIFRGFEETVAHSTDLRSLTVSEKEWRRYLAGRAARVRPRTLEPAFVEVTGEGPADDPGIESRLSGFSGQPLDEDGLQAALTRITGLGQYDTAAYRKTVREGEEGLGVRVHEKTYGPPFIKPIVKINAGQSGDMTFEIAGRMTLYDVWQRDNEWRFDASFGRLNLLSTELYQFLGGSQWFVAPRAFGRYETQFLFSDGDRIADYGITGLGAGADVGYNFGHSSELRLGYQYGWQKANVRSGSPELPAVSGPASALAGQWEFDRLNSAMVPTNGIAVRTRGSWQIDAPGAGSRVVQFGGRIMAARPVSGRWSTQWTVAGGGTFRGSAGPIQKYTLGGPSRIGALGLDERRGDNYVYTSGGVLRLLSESPGGFVERIFAGAWYEGGDAYDNTMNWFHSGSIGITGETKLGLFYVGGAVGESGRVKFYVSLGKFF